MYKGRPWSPRSTAAHKTQLIITKTAESRGGKKWRGREEADVSIQLLPAAPLVTLGWAMDPGA